MSTKNGPNIPNLIDITPTWEQIVPALLLCLESGNAFSREFAVGEITRMAKLADMKVAELRAQDT